MNEVTARQVVWLAAIQEVAGARAALPPALPVAGAADGEWRDCFASTIERQPRLGALERTTRIPAWIGIALPVLAFLMGLLAETLPGAGRVNLIAMPVLGLLLWNLGIYVWLFVGPRADVASHDGGGFRHWLTERCEAWIRLDGDADEDVWRRVRRSFVQRWSNHVRPLLSLRVELILHLAAATAMLGLIAGMYLRGLGFEYRAGWSSTFLDGESLRSLLGVVLAPAAWVSGLGLPDAAALERLAWARNPEGENAARWIHLYAITAVIYVGIPRLLFALVAARRMARLREDFPVDPAALGFAASTTSALMDPNSPRARRICVLPFNLELTARDRELLRFFATGEAGGPVQLDVRGKIDYADIEEQLAAFEAAPDAHAHAVVLNLSTTPEAEVQGLLLAGLGERVEKLLVYLDGAAFTERFGEEPDFAERLATRKALWTRFLEPYSLKPIFLRAEP